MPGIVMKQVSPIAALSNSAAFVILIMLLAIATAPSSHAQTTTDVTGNDAPASSAAMQSAEAQVNALEEPLYSPFIERYVLDELKQLRTEMANQKVDLTKQMVDREHTAIDRAVTYATDTVTYFFYLIAGATSILVMVGWTSIREIKERVHSLADEEISKLVREYEDRLAAIELQLNQKSRHIEENREEIERTQEVQSLWLRAAQDNNPNNKIAIYDEILTLRPDDGEALTYKADAVLELDEPQWASHLCQQALAIDPDNSHAFYQLGCAHVALEQFDKALRYLKAAMQQREAYREEMIADPALAALREHEGFIALTHYEASDAA